MSSRNEYLTIEQTKDVKIIWESLQLAKKMLDDGVVDPVIIRKSISSTLLRVDTLKIDYVSIVDIKNLIEINQPIRGDLLISVAVFVGGVRLIDNVFYNY
jgi:pantoate--beta-alanine ligase